MSETPQSDPRQGFGENHPTRPLGQAAPAWGPVAQGPGQVPPPMPGQAPPPMPGHVPPPVPVPVPPVAQSAWSQQVPAGGPGGGPRGGRRGWLIGGAAALAVAVIVGVAVAMSGGDGNDTASGLPSGIPGGAAEPEQPTGKAFTKAPKGCELVKAATVTGIIPGAACTPGLFDDKDLASMITRSPSWKREDSGGPYQTLDVHLSIGPGADGNYDMKKEAALKDMGTLRKVIASRPISGLGEEAFVVYAGDSEGSLTQAQVIVREGNAVVTTDYTFSRKDSATTQKQAEDAAVAVARDVFAALS